ncbi:unnamed protein product [Paramecium sonneborni]|uniref:Uncharacterized protein n=1 Tax=Paramecium sonneborni TaxID=65129 RepID=A0A8S1RLB7_9CILI|nr:unnamed protein product [Paramecium sonneborni]
MKYSVLIYLIATAKQFLVENVCKCEQLQSKEDCDFGKAQCLWMDQKCVTIQCESFDGKTEQECIDFVGCAINDVGNCRPFSDCIDYHVSDKTKCSTKWPTCVAGDNLVNGKYECQELGDDNIYYVCSKIEKKELCTAEDIEGQDAIKQADGQVCDWIIDDDDVGKCIAYDPNKCSNIISQSKCDHFLCKWDTEKEECSEPFCIEIVDKTKCNFLRGDQTGTYQICKWEDELCQDAEDTSFLTQSNCLQNSFYSATWNGTNCNICENDGFSTLISMTVVIILIF